jgi:hypothetical protein
VTRRALALTRRHAWEVPVDPGAGGWLWNVGHFRHTFASIDADALTLCEACFAGCRASGSTSTATLSLRMLSPLSSIL